MVRECIEILPTALAKDAIPSPAQRVAGHVIVEEVMDSRARLWSEFLKPVRRCPTVSDVRVKQETVILLRNDHEVQLLTSNEQAPFDQVVQSQDENIPTMMVDSILAS